MLLNEHISGLTSMQCAAKSQFVRRKVKFKISYRLHLFNPNGSFWTHMKTRVSTCSYFPLLVIVTGNWLKRKIHLEKEMIFGSGSSLNKFEVTFNFCSWSLLATVLRILPGFADFHFIFHLLNCNFAAHLLDAGLEICSF